MIFSASDGEPSRLIMGHSRSDECGLDTAELTALDELKFFLLWALWSGQVELDDGQQ